MRIACLHTATSNISVFETAAKALGIDPDVLLHEVRPDLLAAAGQAGHLTADTVASTASALLALAEHADAVVLTCSTLGPAIEHIPSHIQVPILRADEALAVAAVNAGGTIVVLCAVETTLEPTARIFHQVAQHTDASVQVQWVAGAWALYKAGDIEGYLAAIARAADRAYVEGADIVALGQASMSAAVNLVRSGPPPLSSATAGLAAAVQAIKPNESAPPSLATLEL